MQRSVLSSRDRTGAALAVLLVHGGLALLLLNASGSLGDEEREQAAIETFDVTEPPPPPLEQPEPPPPPPQAEAERQPVREAPREEGASAPPNLESQAAPLDLPKPVVELPRVAEAVASPTPAQGTQATQGAAPVPGPGTGAGGIGAGTGSGGTGSGSGGGGAGAGGLGSGPRLIAGDISRRDYPRELRGSQVPLEVIHLEYQIGTDGRVRNCRVLRSSGTPLLDAHTCRLYEQRYRYRPARDRAGQPIPITVRATRSWYIRGRGSPFGG